ncbi:Ecdysone-induced protein 78C [Taenia crassiceps]|uniref:Ecdysone-induced protein 78C n=1 Tax=Taenia crassiceps TaxID=6207 RepID=A0ABR4QNS1_9CEST
MMAPEIGLSYARFCLDVLGVIEFLIGISYLALTWDASGTILPYFGFFRRSIQKQIEYKCLREGKCTVVRLNRNRCQYCRFRKCIAAGMSKDSVRYGRMPRRSSSPDSGSIQTPSVSSPPQMQQKTPTRPSPSSSACATTAPAAVVSPVATGVTDAPVYRQPKEAGEVALYNIVVTIGKAHLNHCPYIEQRVKTIKMVKTTLPQLTCAIFEFAAEFCALNLSDIEIGLFSAVLLTKPNRHGLSDTAKVVAMHEQFLAALSYQLEEKHESASDVMSKLTLATSRLAQLSESMHFTMSWFRSYWYRTRLSPLYSELYDIPQGGESTARPPQTQPYMPIDFQSLAYTPSQAPMAYSTGTASYTAPKTPQTIFHYHQYQNFPASQDYLAIYNAQGNTYPNMTDYTDESQHQQFLYTPSQERWHSSAFEPYSTDMQSTVRAYGHEAQRVDSDAVGDASRDENASTSAYTESHVRSRSHSSTTSPRFSSNDIGQSNSNRPPLPPPPSNSSSRGAANFVGEAKLINRNVISMSDNTIVSGDDPFAAYQSIDVPVVSRANSSVANIEAESMHPNWGDLSGLNGLEKDANGLKPEMPTLIPAPEIMAAIERGKDISLPLQSIADEDVETGEVLPVESRNGS